MSLFKVFALPVIALAAVLGLLFTPKSVDIPLRGVPLFTEPSYDSYAPLSADLGSHTISQRATDAEGNRWGKLGEYWVDLDALEALRTDTPPLTAWYAESDKLGGRRYESYSDGPIDISTVALAFYPSEDLRDIRFYTIDYGEGGEEVWTELHAFDSLKADSAFLAAVKFYGDLTLYGISCTDGEGVSHRYLVSISGRNNALLLTER